LVENDQNILSDIRTQKKELDEKKQQLIAKMGEAEKLKEQAEAARTYLDNSKAKKEVALAENKKDQEELITQIEKLEKDSKELEAKIRELQKKNSGIKGSVSVWPTPGYWYITSPYGYRRHPITKQYKLHTGVDIGPPMAPGSFRPEQGVVIFSGWYGAYGNAVIMTMAMVCPPCTAICHRGPSPPMRKLFPDRPSAMLARPAGVRVRISTLKYDKMVFHESDGVLQLTSWHIIGKRTISKIGKW
jgi:murein DD-endopeptidase MepM/ murein hydrolase activator NlpD